MRTAGKEIGALPGRGVLDIARKTPDQGALATGTETTPKEKAV